MSDFPLEDRALWLIDERIWSCNVGILKSELNLLKFNQYWI
jgi:hypothetical protein